MAFTYVAPTSPLWKVRFLIQDTTAATAQLQDEEIAWLLSESGGSVYRAAAAAAQALASRYASDVDRSVSGAGGLSVSGSQRFQQYTQLAQQLTAQAGKKGRGVPFAGGISEAQKDATEEDADRVRPAFTREIAPLREAEIEEEEEA